MENWDRSGGNEWKYFRIFLNRNISRRLLILMRQLSFANYSNYFNDVSDASGACSLLHVKYSLDFY